MLARRHSDIKDEWLALLEVISQLGKQPYTNPVGRTIFQKISYVMTELGLNTGFAFKQGSYGPFSPDVQSALTVVANANLILEKQLGQMTAIEASPEYDQKRPEFISRLQPFQKQIEKTIDLFSRIKNTAQAEEVTTVLFAIQKLKRENPPEGVSEEDVLNFILNWKKKWNQADKIEAIVSTIRNLEMLSWIKLVYSPSITSDLF